MWEKRANEEGMLAASELFRNTAPAFADRGLPGSAEPIRQIPELITRAKERLARFYEKFDRQLAGNEFVAGNRYSVADITALCAIDFGKWTDLDIPPERANLQPLVRFGFRTCKRQSLRQDPKRSGAGHIAMGSALACDPATPPARQRRQVRPARSRAARHS